MTRANLVTACDIGLAATVEWVPGLREQVERAPRWHGGTRFLAGLVTMVMTAAACAPSAEAPAGTAAPSGDPTSSATEPSNDDPSGVEPRSLEAGTRIGDGRAVIASTGDQTTVVVTTIGVQAMIGDRMIDLDTEPALGPPTGLDVSDDGSRAVLTWPDRVELWGLGSEIGLVRGLDSPGVTATLADRTLFLVTEAELRVLDGSDGTELARHTAPGSGRFGPIAVDPAGAWWAIPVSDPDGAPELLVSMEEGEPVRQPMVGRDGLLAFQAEADPTGPRVFVGLSQDGERHSGGEIVAWDLDTGAASSTQVVDPAALWDVGADGGLVILDRERIRRIDPGGVERPAQAAPEGYPPFAVHHLAAGGFVAVLQDGSRLLLGPEDQVESQPAEVERFVLTSQEAGQPATASIVDHTGSITVLEPDGTVRRRIDALVAGTINDIDISVDGDLAVATSTGSINLLSGDAELVGWTSELAHAEGNVDTVVFSPDGTQLVGGVAERRSEVVFDDTVAVWDLADERRIVEIGGEREEVQDCSSFANVVRLASDGSFLVGVSHDFTVFVLDGATYERRLTLPPHAGPVLDLAVSLDDRLLATTSEDSTMRLWDIGSGEMVAEYPTIVGGYRSIDFLPDGTILAADRQGMLSVLAATTGEVERTFESTVSGAADVEVSPDGRFVASGDGTVLRVWSVDTGAVVDEFHGHYGSVTSMAFGREGDILVSGSADGTAVVWDLQS